MENIFNLIINNREWLFSGIGLFIITIIFNRMKPKEGHQMKEEKFNAVVSPTMSTTISPVITITSNNDNKAKDINSLNDKSNDDFDLEKAKRNTKILFIDDDTKFKVISILRKSGWIHTKIIKDISNLDSTEVKETDIFFVDIQGVGVKLNFQDEGLGLADALKTKYPEKKVVIYSAENRGKIFHDALKKADDSLQKNAEPFQFQTTIEGLLRK